MHEECKVKEEERSFKKVVAAWKHVLCGCGGCFELSQSTARRHPEDGILDLGPEIKVNALQA